MIILGIDPGETLIGYCILEKSRHNLNLIDCGCINISSLAGKIKKNAGQKLAELENQITGLINKHRPELAGVEEIFFFKNLKTAIRVAQARGVILAACHKNNLEILEFTPLQVKQSVTGYGRADKKQVQKMVGMILKLNHPLTQDDAADAVAIAICAAESSKLLSLTKQR